MGLAHTLEPCGRQGVRCVVCGAFTEGLLTWCPGFRLDESDMGAIVKGKVIDLEATRVALDLGHSPIYDHEEEDAARDLSEDEAMDAFMEYMEDTTGRDA